MKALRGGLYDFLYKAYWQECYIEEGVFLMSFLEWIKINYYGVKE